VHCWRLGSTKIPPAAYESKPLYKGITSQQVQGLKNTVARRLGLAVLGVGLASINIPIVRRAS
jgi:hypothetical protein